MTWIVKCRTGYRYCSNRDGSVWGPAQKDARRFKTREAATMTAELGAKSGPKFDPPYVVRLRKRADKYEEALRGLIDNIKTHHDRACPGITPADCLDAIYEAAEIARAVLPSSTETK